MPNVFKLFTSIIYKCSKEDREFAPRKLLRPSVMFEGKARAFLKGEPLRIHRLVLALPANIRLGWKDQPDTNSQVYWEHSSITYVKRFVTLTPVVN
jgi:hypothetical protein